MTVRLPPPGIYRIKPEYCEHRDVTKTPYSTHTTRVGEPNYLDPTKSTYRVHAKCNDCGTCWE